MPRSRLNRIGKPLREANILRVVVSPESLVMNVPARHDVVLGRRDRKELTEGFSVLLDEAFRFLAIRSYAVTDRIDHPAFDVMESLGVVTPVGGLPRRSALSRFTPVIGISVALLGLVLVRRKVGLPQDLPDFFHGERLVIHCILQQYV